MSGEINAEQRLTCRMNKASAGKCVAVSRLEHLLLVLVLLSVAGTDSPNTGHLVLQNSLTSVQASKKTLFTKFPFGYRLAS